MSLQYYCIQWAQMLFRIIVLLYLFQLNFSFMSKRTTKQNATPTFSADVLPPGAIKAPPQMFFRVFETQNLKHKPKIWTMYAAPWVSLSRRDRQINSFHFGVLMSPQSNFLQCHQITGISCPRGQMLFYSAIVCIVPKMKQQLWSSALFTWATDCPKGNRNFQSY